MQRWHMPPTQSKTRGTLKSSSTRGNQKVGYGWQYMEEKGKPFALVGGSQDNELGRILEIKTSQRSSASVRV